MNQNIAQSNKHNDIEKGKQLFEELYHAKPEVISRAPGRAEIIGNHTDYNNGYALASGITHETRTFISKRDDLEVHVYSHGYSTEPELFQLENIIRGEQGYWLNYVKGVIQEIKRLYPDMQGMNIMIQSNVPSSGGVSSSAALELSVATAVLQLFSVELEAVKKAHMCQKAENGELVGIPCGFLDQASSGLSKRDNLLFLDFLPTENMPVSEIKYIPVDLKKYTMSFVVIVDREVKRNLGSSGYPARRAQCERSLPILSKMLGRDMQSLRDVSVVEFESCRGKLDEIDTEMRKRVEHIVYENQRVLDAMKALESGDMNTFGAILTAAGKSALELYELDAQTPELTKLVTAGRTIAGVVGIRNMGGGFSAIALALVENAKMQSFQEQLNTRYGKDLEYLSFEPTDGASVLFSK